MGRLLAFPPAATAGRRKAAHQRLIGSWTPTAVRTEIVGTVRDVVGTGVPVNDGFLLQRLETAEIYGRIKVLLQLEGVLGIEFGSAVYDAEEATLGHLVQEALHLMSA